MEKQESKNTKNMKNQTSQGMKFKSKRDKSLPWWVELLFVQIGLPDKLLIRILKTKKNFKELINKERKSIFAILFFLTLLAYFYPVVKQSKYKLECEYMAKNYILDKKNLTNINKKQLRMLSTNFCNGGDEIYEFKNKK